MTGLLCLGAESWVSHEAAAALHDLDRHVDGAVEFTVLRARRGLEVPFRLHTTATLPASTVPRSARSGVCRRPGRSSTSPGCGSAGTGSKRPSTAPSDRGLTGRAAAALTGMRASGQWGVRLLDRLLVDTGGHTMLERRFLELVREAGLPDRCRR